MNASGHATALTTTVGIGLAVGAWVVLDPYLTTALRGLLPLFLSGQHVLALLPWELTLALTVPVVIVGGVAWWLRRHCPGESATFSVLFLVTMQTVAIHAFGPLDLSDIVVLGGVAWVLARRLLDDGRIIVPPSFMWSLLLVICAFLSAANGGTKSLLGSVLFIKSALLALLIPNMLRDRAQVAFFCWTLIAVTAASAVFAIIQEIVFVSTGELLVGFAVEAKSLRHLFEETSVGTLFRVTALNISYKHFSFLLASSLLLALSFYIFDRPTHGRPKQLLMPAIVLIAIGLGLTFSKDALLGTIFGLAILVFLRWPFALVPAAGSFAILLAVLVATGLGGELMRGLGADIHWGESRIRLQLARDGLYGVLNQETLIGRGVNNSARYTHNFNKWVPHNNVIAAAADIGVLGLVAFVTVMGQMLYRLLGAVVRAVDRSTRAIALGLLAGSLAILISIQFHGLYILTVLWMMLGLTDAFLRTTIRQNALARIPEPPDEPVRAA